jgi:hypothetical protein
MSDVEMERGRQEAMCGAVQLLLLRLLLLMLATIATTPAAAAVSHRMIIGRHAAVRSRSSGCVNDAHKCNGRYSELAVLNQY